MRHLRKEPDMNDEQLDKIMAQVDLINAQVDLITARIKVIAEILRVEDIVENANPDAG
jgi:prefoldin subunit 5